MGIALVVSHLEAGWLRDLDVADLPEEVVCALDLMPLIQIQPVSLDIQIMNEIILTANQQLGVHLTTTLLQLVRVKPILGTISILQFMAREDEPIFRNTTLQIRCQEWI